MNALPRFSGVEAWTRLEPETQAKIGALVLEMAVASYAVGLSQQRGELSPRLRAIDHGGQEISHELYRTVITAIGDTIDWNKPPVPSLIGGVCRGCGCTDFKPCPCGCSWAAPDLCSACAGSAHVETNVVSLRRLPR